ncbi:ABC superfamily ATP binding cassette transporter permease [Acaromyces ingoldii]|uniref:ABC superfamily ATP binding cassette transporter permease n=1 Tax=Acaromyces ingoldii TaxID=215250 RepID=A0A316YRX8_9BASI|nr:ABC superfamily ATP binding cassette transporter permease [Acaromyces ingoldii]PWN91766.1 ABC superfamily ATP binding cassette transporter permease [Acaromyces ingoldii]
MGTVEQARCCVGLVGPLDVKRAEYEFATRKLEELGCHVVVLDVTTRDMDDDRQGHASDTHCSPRQVLDEIISTASFNALDRGERTEAMRAGALRILGALKHEGRLHALAGFGGSQTTSLVTWIMRSAVFEIGFPKVAVTTMMAGDVAGYAGETDIVFWPSIVDISGRLNSISELILTNTCHAVAALAASYQARLRASQPTGGVRQASRKPHVALTMFGLTTPCVNECSRLLSEKGFEPVVFHASGVGGRSMERLINEGLFDAVLDLTTTELADEQLGGVLSAGPSRLTAAHQKNIPQLISVGALDMCNFGSLDTVPGAFRERKLHAHNEKVTLLRTNAEENRQLGEVLVNKVKGSTFKILFPTKGTSGIDIEGGSFEDKEARGALLDGIRSALGDASSEHLIPVDLHINDAAFAARAVDELVSLYNSKQPET